MMIPTEIPLKDVLYLRRSRVIDDQTTFVPIVIDSSLDLFDLLNQDEQIIVRIALGWRPISYVDGNRVPQYPANGYRLVGNSASLKRSARFLGKLTNMDPLNFSFTDIATATKVKGPTLDIQRARMVHHARVREQIRRLEALQDKFPDRYSVVGRNIASLLDAATRGFHDRAFDDARKNRIPIRTFKQFRDSWQYREDLITKIEQEAAKDERKF